MIKPRFLGARAWPEPPPFGTQGKRLASDSNEFQPLSGSKPRMKKTTMNMPVDAGRGLLPRGAGEGE